MEGRKAFLKRGRNTQGVKLIRLESADNEYVSTVAIVGREEEEEKDLDIETVTTLDPDSDPEPTVIEENEETEKDTEE